MLTLFRAAIFLNAVLLFLVQPMFAKMALPLLGGSPAVWTTCMLFFQTTLLLGYLYSHLSIRLLGVRRQCLLHTLLVIAPMLLLPIGFPPDTRPPAGGAAKRLAIGGDDGGGRFSIPLALDYGAPAAEMVCSRHRGRVGRALSALRCEQCRKPRRPDPLPRLDRAVPAGPSSAVRVVSGIRSHGRLGDRLRLHDSPLEHCAERARRAHDARPV